MNWTDYCIIGVLALSVLMGLWRGFIGEVLALACWVIAFWVAWVFGPRLAESFTAIDAPSVRLLLGYAICFVAVLIGGAIVSFLMRKLISGSGSVARDDFWPATGVGAGNIAGIRARIYPVSTRSLVAAVAVAADVPAGCPLVDSQSSAGSIQTP